MSEISVTLADGRTMAAGPWQPHTVAEQLGFEHQFRLSYLNVRECIRQTLLAGDSGEQLDEQWVLRTEWLLYFAWRRMPDAPKPFSAFVDQLAAYDFVDGEEDEPPPADPTVPAATSAPGP